MPLRLFLCGGCGEERATHVMPEGWVRAIVYANLDGHGATRVGTVTACSTDCAAMGLDRLFAERAS